MDVTAVNNLTINRPINNPPVTSSNEVNSAANENKAAENELPWGFVNLSPECFIRSGYWRGFCDFFAEEKAAKDLNLNESVFSRFAAKYMNQKADIVQNYTGDTQKKHLQWLDQAANDALESYSGSLSRNIASFFNFRSKVYQSRLGEEIEPAFDEKEFFNRILTISRQTLKIAKETNNSADALNKIEAYLAENGDNSRLEQLSFRDITVLSQCLKNTKEYHPSKVGDIFKLKAADRYKAVSQYSEQFSEKIRMFVKGTAVKNLTIATMESDYIALYHKHLDDQDRLWKRLSELYAKREGLLKQLEDYPEMPLWQKLRFMKRLDSMGEMIKDCSEQIKNDKKAQAEDEKAYHNELKEEYLNDPNSTNQYSLSATFE